MYGSFRLMKHRYTFQIFMFFFFFLVILAKRKYISGDYYGIDCYTGHCYLS